ncbi:MAG: glycosyltransferase [Erysipelotrichales bacterium]|nr:glycosyltransferase [Erysipelotrichales bacterium]
MRKRIFWVIQQVHKVGGAEIVTINLANKLIEFYDITLIVIADFEKPIVEIDSRIKLLNLKVAHKYIYIDKYISEKAKRFRFDKIIIAIFQLIFFWLFGKYRYRRMIKDMTTEEDLIIASAMDSYMFAPKKRKVYFHFHFNYRFFRKFYHRFGLLMCRKPDKWLFLTESTLKRMPKRIQKKATYVYNPSRLEAKLQPVSETKKIIFLSRFVNQKKPLKAIKVAEILKQKKATFELHFYGDGILERKMIKAIKKRNLEDVCFLRGKTDNVAAAFDSADLLLLTSSFEGFPLSILEANSRSVPVISSNWGDACPEIIIKDKNGYICQKNEEMADKIIELLNDSKKLECLREETYRIALSNSWDKIIKKWKNIIND